MFCPVIDGNSFPQILAVEEEKKYLDKYENGNEEEKQEAKNVLITRNLRLVAHVVKKYTIKGVEQDDLISIGTIGLIKGITTYKISRGTKLATYVSRCIENEILMELRRLKSRSREMFLSDPVGVDKEGNSITLEDRLKDEGYSIEESVGMKLDGARLSKIMMSALTERERRIIITRYGLINGEEKTQREVAKMLSISRSYVSRIEKRALEKLSVEFN
ncbi:MAG: RNA polymerase sporulation sigma factor SigK [Defluviitaleaceae bacterium]|nr:RNA polymerase sporulation sigma factor SigK [Defluviitaleaceae bacterium]